MGTGQAFGRMILLLGLSALGACGGGGGGNLAASIPSGVTPPTTTVASSPQPTPATVYPPPPSGVFQPAVSGSFGPSPASVQFALPGGSAFDGASGPLPVANTSFPVLASSLINVIAPSGDTWTADTNSPSATATVLYAAAGSTTLQLSIPALNLTSQLNSTNLNFLSYVGFGDWAFPSPIPGRIDEWSFVVFGYETPVTAMPTSGTASYSGPGKLSGVIFDSDIHNTVWLNGDASFSVDFASGKVAGAFTKNTWSDISDIPYPFPDVTANASIAAGTNRFSGTTAVSPQSTTPTASSPSFIPGNSATGSINGVFYGPAAQNLGAIWTLSDGHHNVLGTVGAAR